MDPGSLDNFISILDYTINTKKKKHLIGGMLLSVSLLFGGLAFTVMTIKMEEIDHE